MLDSVNISTPYQHRDALNEQVNDNPPAKLFTGLGIHSVRMSATLELYAQLGSLDVVSDCGQDALTTISDIGPTMMSC